jgi:hypothetical protein
LFENHLARAVLHDLRLLFELRAGVVADPASSSLSRNSSLVAAAKSRSSATSAKPILMRFWACMVGELVARVLGRSA